VEDETARRPDPLLAVGVTFDRIVVSVVIPRMMAAVIFRMRCDVRVPECGGWVLMLMCVVQAPRGLVHMSVGCRDEPEQEGHHGNGGP
jgi:hypothetical protein